MNQTTYYKIQQRAYKRSVWILLLSIWLFSSSLSIVHAQEHIIEVDTQCQLCLTSFSHTPFLLSESFQFVPSIQKPIATVFLNTQLLSLHHLYIGNRDPPY